MYLALTYDHRLLDGREAVTFLVKVRLSLSDGLRVEDTVSNSLNRSRNTSKILAACCWVKPVTVRCSASSLFLVNGR